MVHGKSFRCKQVIEVIEELVYMIKKPRFAAGAGFEDGIDIVGKVFRYLCTTIQYSGNEPLLAWMELAIEGKYHIKIAGKKLGQSVVNAEHILSRQSHLNLMAIGGNHGTQKWVIGVDNILA